MAEAIGRLGGLVMESHGAMGVGRDMRTAMVACDNVERTCEMFLAIRGAGGGVKPLPEAYLRDSREKSLRRRGVAAG